MQNDEQTLLNDATYVAPVIQKPVTQLDRYLYNRKQRGIPDPGPPLINVNPLYDILTLARGIYTLPKGFLKGLGKVPLKQENFYRQASRATRPIEDAMERGVIAVKSDVPEIVPGKISLTKDFSVPFFRQGNTWFGHNPKFDIIVGKNGNGIQFVPIDKSGRFVKPVLGKTLSRATPIYNGSANAAPAQQFSFYRYYPVIGYRNVTNGFPVMPITGLDFTRYAVDSGQ